MWHNKTSCNPKVYGNTFDGCNSPFFSFAALPNNCFGVVLLLYVHGKQLQSVWSCRDRQLI